MEDLFDNIHPEENDCFNEYNYSDDYQSNCIFFHLLVSQFIKIKKSREGYLKISARDTFLGINTLNILG